MKLESQSFHPVGADGFPLPVSKQSKLVPTFTRADWIERFIVDGLACALLFLCSWIALVSCNEAPLPTVYDATDRPASEIAQWHKGIVGDGTQYEPTN